MTMCVHCGLKPKVKNYGSYCSCKCYLDAKPKVKEKRRKYLVKYYQANKEKIIEKSKKWREEHLEHNKEYYQRPEVKEKHKRRMREQYREKRKLTPKNIKRVCNRRRGIFKDFGFNNLAEEVKQDFTEIYKEVKEDGVEQK